MSLISKVDGTNHCLVRSVIPAEAKIYKCDGKDPRKNKARTNKQCLCRYLDHQKTPASIESRVEELEELINETENKVSRIRRKDLWIRSQARGIEGVGPQTRSRDSRIGRNEAMLFHPTRLHASI